MASPDDAARKWTDAELESLERRMRREYQQAAKEMRGKQAKWLERFDREREMREKALDNTPEAMEAHKRWLASQTARSDWMGGMADQLAESAHQANVRATAMVNDHIPRVFSENANRAAYAIEGKVGADLGFQLVNEDAVRRLMGVGETDGQLIPEVVKGEQKLGPADVQSLRKRELDYPKDMRWNRQKFTSAITQGILQGESIPNIVKRTEDIYGRNSDSAIRAARTATTNAENAGRMNSFERAQRLGIDMEIEWEATLDERTRESHRRLDGQRVQVGEFFETENGPIRWPGDPMADPAETWNCRCRADGRVVGFDGERGAWADEEPGERWARLPEGMTYEQWKSAKAVSRAESYENEAGRLLFTKPTQNAIIAPEEFTLDVSAQVWQGAGAQAYDHAGELLRQSDDTVRSVWSKYEGQMTLVDGNHKGGAYHSSRGVFMNVQKDLSDTRTGPLSTWFHEFGHHLDATGGYDKHGGGLRNYISDQYRTADGRTFGDVIRGEVQEKVKVRQKEMVAAWKRVDEILGMDMLPDSAVKEAYELISRHELLPSYIIPGSYADSAGVDAMLEHWVFKGVPKPNKEAAYKAVGREIDEMADVRKHSLSDMFEGATKGKCRDSWGHGKSYWAKRPTGLEREAFAEFYSAEAIYSETPATLDVLREWLPESYKAFREMLEGML